MNSQLQSGPPQLMLPTASGTSIVPRCSPSGLKTQTPSASRRAGDPDVAALVELHPVDEVADVEVARADAVGDTRPLTSVPSSPTSNTRMCARSVSLT